MNLKNQVKINYTPAQLKIFFGSKARVKLIHKGRRFGLTRGFALFCIDYCFQGGKKVLWVDTINQNIERYFERYFQPILKEQIRKDAWTWNKFKKELKLFNCLVDFRSADRPESIEGFGYDLIIINEAGIVLKDEYLWYNAIVPMTLDFHAEMLIGGTPKGKRNRKLGKKHLFAELCDKATEREDWEVFQFSSYDNPLLNAEDIKELEAEVPHAVRRQEIHGDFIDSATSEIIKEGWWKRFTDFPHIATLKIDSWDTAHRDKEENDFTVKTSWMLSAEGLFLYDYWKDKPLFPELKRKVISEYQKNLPDIIIIEDKASGISLIDELKETALPVKAIKVDRDKVARANAASIMWENGKVFIRDKQEWTKSVIELCSDFPSGEEDDTVDSITQAVNYLKGNISNNIYEILTLEKETSFLDNYNSEATL